MSAYRIKLWNWQGLSVLFFSLFLFGSNSASATIEGNLQTIDCNYFATDGMYYRAPVYGGTSRELGQDFVPSLSGILNSITFKYLQWDIEQPLWDDLMVYVLDDQQNLLTVGTADSNNGGLPQYGGCGNGDPQKFNFDGTFLMTGGEHYRFYLTYIPPVKLSQSNKLLVPTLYSNSNLSDPNNYNGTSSTYLKRDYNAQEQIISDSVYNASNDFYFEVEYTGQPNEQITFTNPTNGTDLPAGLNTFTGTFTNPQYKNNFVGIVVWNNFDSNSSSTRHSEYYFNSASTSGTWSVDFTLPQGEYRALSLFGSSTNNNNSFFGDNINPFTVGGGELSTTSFATSYCQQSMLHACDDIAATTTLGAIWCGLKRAGIDFVCPSLGSVQNFKNSADSLKQSFPFSVFFQLTDLIETAATNASSSVNTLSVPMVRQTSTSSEFYMLPFVSSSTLANAVGNDNAALIRTSLGWLMWLTVAIVISIQIF